MEHVAWICIWSKVVV